MRVLPLTPLERLVFAAFWGLVGAICTRLLIGCGGVAFSALERDAGELADVELLDGSNSGLEAAADVVQSYSDAQLVDQADAGEGGVTPAGDAAADVAGDVLEHVDAGDAGPDAAADVDAGLCCVATGAPSCLQACSFPCSACALGNPCSHVDQGVNYAGTVESCP